MGKLTALAVKYAKPGRHGDGAGLYLLVSATGAKSWMIRIQQNGKRRDIGLGPVAALSLSEARQRAVDLRKHALNGRDFIAERDRDKRPTPTFKEATKATHAALKKGWVNVSADVANSDQYRAAYQQRFGKPAPLAVDVVGGQVTPEAKTELEKTRDTFGGDIDAAVRGAADMASLGAADPLAALARSAFNDDGFAVNLTRERAISGADEKVNPYWRLGGQIAGAIPTMTGLSKAGAAFTPARPFLGTAVADTAGGAVYGGLSIMEKDPLTGALVGGGAALAGNQIGQRVIGRWSSGCSRGAGEISPVARVLASNTKPLQITNARAAILDGLRLKLPIALADADPQLRAIAGSATCISPAARETAERLLEPRGRGQADSIAELLLNPVPTTALSAIDQITIARALAPQAKSVGGSVGAGLTLPLVGVE